MADLLKVTSIETERLAGDALSAVNFASTVAIGAGVDALLSADGGADGVGSCFSVRFATTGASEEPARLPQPAAAIMDNKVDNNSRLFVRMFNPLIETRLHDLIFVMAVGLTGWPI